MRFLALLLVGCVFVANAASAENELDELLGGGGDEALRASQEALTNPTIRNEAAKNPQAAAAMKALERLAGDAGNAERIYKLAAGVLGTLVKETGGNVDKMMELLKNGAKDPAAFGDRFTAQQKTELGEIARSIEGGKVP